MKHFKQFLATWFVATVQGGGAIVVSEKRKSSNDNFVSDRFIISGTLALIVLVLYEVSYLAARQLIGDYSWLVATLAPTITLSAATYDLGAYVTAILKSFVWPTYVVYKLLENFYR